MIVQIILTTVGANTGPNFDLYSDVDSYETPFATSVPKAALVAGYISSVVPNGTTVVRVVSFGTCNTAVDINISLLPVTTTTTTTWPVPITTTSTTSTTSTTTSTTSTTSTTTSTTSTTSTTTTAAPTTTTTTTEAPVTTTTTTTEAVITTTTTTTTEDPGAYWNAQYCTGSSTPPILRVPSSAVSGQVVFADITLDTCASLTTPYVGTPSSYVDRRTYPLYSNCIACNNLVNHRWATMVRCDNPSITAYSQWFNVGDFSVDDIVTQNPTFSSPPYYNYRITSISTDSSGFPQFVIQATGLSSCSDTTTTTTTAAPTTTTTTTPVPTTTTTTTPAPQYLSYDLYYPCGTTNPASLRLPYTGNLDPGVIVMGCVDGTCYCYTVAGPTFVGGAQLTENGEFSSCPVCNENIPIPTTTTTTTTPPPATTTSTTTAPTTTTTTTGGTPPPFTGCIKWTNVYDYDQPVSCTDPSGTSSGTDVYYELTVWLYETDGVTPKNAPAGGLLVSFDVETSGSCSGGGGAIYTVEILAGNNTVIAPYQQTNYSECGYGCGYNTFTPFQFAYTNYPLVNECPV